MVSRTLLETALIVGGWALAAVSAVLFALGQPVAAVTLAVVAVAAFGIHAVSFKSKPAADYLTRDLLRAQTHLRRGYYTDAARAADASLRIQGPDSPLLPPTLMVSAVALAASGDHQRSREVLAILDDVPREDTDDLGDLGVVIRRVARIIDRHLNAGEPNPESLVANYLRLSDALEQGNRA